MILNVPERSAAAFSRQWYARGDWKLDEPTIMMKVDKTRQKMNDLLWQVQLQLAGSSVRAKTEKKAIACYDYLHWMYFSVGVYRTFMRSGEVLPTTSRGNPRIQWKLMYERIYPQGTEKKDWDKIVLGNPDEESVKKGFCVVMPSMETVEWLNKVAKLDYSYIAE